MAEPFTLATIAAGCVWGLIGNRADAAAVAGGRKLVGVLSGTQTPQNHDVLRATHTAWLKSVQVMAGLAEGATTVWDDHASLKALKKAVRDPALTELRFDGGNFPHAELERLIGEIYRANADPDAVVVEAVISRVETVMGEPLTDGLRAVFRTGHAGKRGWAATFQLFFSQAVKDDAAVFRILTFERLNEVVVFAASHGEALAELDHALTSFHDEVRSAFTEVKDAQAAQTALLRQILENQGAGEQASVELLRAFARAYAEEQDSRDLEGLKAYLFKKIDQWRDYGRRVEALEAEGNRDSALLADAKIATDRGDFATADALLAEAVQSLDAKIAPLLAARANRLALRAANAKLAGDYRRAITLYDEAYHTLPETEMEARISHEWLAAKTVHDWGSRLGEHVAPAEAVDRWLALSHKLEFLPLESRVALHQNLGSAYRLLAGSKGALHNLGLGIRAYETAIALCESPEMAGRQLQARLARAAALFDLGRRGGDEEKLEAVIDACDAILAESSENDGQTFRCDVYHVKGNALDSLGSQRVDPELHRRAIESFECALAEVDKSVDPYAWSLAQQSRGIATKNLGIHEDSLPLFEKAVAAYEAALTFFQLETHPLIWAGLKDDLGNVLGLIGEKTRRVEDFDQAVAAHRQSLDVRQQRALPFPWALTMENLSITLLRKARALDCLASADQAVAAGVEAVVELERVGATWNAAKAQRNLDYARSVQQLLSH